MLDTLSEREFGSACNALHRCGQAVDRTQMVPIDTCACKRVFDVVMSLLALCALLPVLLLISVAVRCDSRGPVLYRQTRRGLNGKPFQVLKFRSMYHAPEASFAQATRNDARITRVGAVLRRSSLDELPQLWNVLRGDMALIGPRPHPIALDDRFALDVPQLWRRYAVKPGLSGLAQVSGHRGETPDADSMRARVMYDIQYIDEWSPWLDIGIIARTLRELWKHELAF